MYVSGPLVWSEARRSLAVGEWAVSERVTIWGWVEEARLRVYEVVGELGRERVIKNTDLKGHLGGEWNGDPI
jgi:hypothetical protein